MLSNPDRVFIDRPPTDRELEVFRLLLSTYQDGSGMQAVEGADGLTTPGWRDFERTTAVAFGGKGGEDKYFVDVVFPLTEQPKRFYGVDCKMKKELDRVDKKHEIYLEVANASKFLWSALAVHGINESNIDSNAQKAGEVLIRAFEEEKRYRAQAYPYGSISLESSYYLALQYSSRGDYQLFQLPMELPHPSDLYWEIRKNQRADGRITTRLLGVQGGRVLYDWYGSSGGQFKYYPNVSAALWSSRRFQLEPLQPLSEQGLIAKSQSYFPELWDKLKESPTPIQPTEIPPNTLPAKDS